MKIAAAVFAAAAIFCNASNYGEMLGANADFEYMRIHKYYFGGES
jgi:hypothetical protein